MRRLSAKDNPGHDALKGLIGDVESEKADFITILVYDVSRWGRFQDADESAYSNTSASGPASTFNTAPNNSRMTAAPVATIVKGITVGAVQK